MRPVRLPLLRGVLLVIALGAISVLMARSDNPAAATSYNPTNVISVSDPTPGASADIQIDFSLNKPDSFPNVRTHSTIQFIPRSWGIHTPETDGANAPPVGGIAGSFNALSTLGVFGSYACNFAIPVPFTMMDASPYTGYDAATGAYDPQKLTSALDIGGDAHPGGPGYSGQFAEDPATKQAPDDLGTPLIPFNADEKKSTYNGGPFDASGLSTAYRDVDGDNLVSAGDIRLTSFGDSIIFKVREPGIVQPDDGDAVYERRLYPFSADEKHAETVAANGQMDAGEMMYRDVDASGDVTYGDIRLLQFVQLSPNSVVQDFGLPGGVTHYPDFLNQMLPPAVVGEPLARQFGARQVITTAVALNIVTYRPGQLPGYPASLGYPNIVILLNPVAPVELYAITVTSDLCTPLSLTSTNFGVSQDNPATFGGEGGYVRLTNPKAEKSHEFTLVTTSQPDADNDGIENMLDTCPLTPNTEDTDGRNKGVLLGGGTPVNPDGDQLDGACDTDPYNPSPVTPGVYVIDDDGDHYGNRADNCSTVANGRQFLNLGYQEVPGFTFFWAISGGLIGPSEQLDTDGDDIGDACEGAESGGPGAPSAGQQCVNADDDDGDGAVNDGCPAKYAEGGDQCLNNLDDDGDAKVNDGCPVAGAAETGSRCNNALDDDGDGKVNDGCRPVYQTGAAETVCDNSLDDDGDGLVNDGCPAVDPGNVARDTITGHMHVVTLTQGVPIYKHGVKLNQLGGPKAIKDGGARTYSVDVSNLGSSAEDVRVALRVVEGCAAVSGPSSVSVPADGSATASFTVDFTGCAAGTYTVQADACHAGDAAPAGLFGSGACPGASDGMTDPNPLDDAPIAKSVEVGSP